jgi:predicted Zn-dependent protease
MPSLIKLISSLLITASLFGCVKQSTKQGTVGVDRKQILLISEKEMVAGAQKAYAQVITEASNQKKLNKNIEMTQRVRTIANRLIPQTSIFRSDAPKWNWEVNVLDSDQLNAWCMPGGKIAFYSGIINKLELTDDEIAAIMGHEMAHALREHGRERASHQVLQTTSINLIGIATGMGRLGMDATSLAMQLTFTLPNSRTHETEADRMGIELAARAGYNPYAAVSLWQKMEKQTKGGRQMEFLSTHP